MIVVADSSILIALSAIGQLDLLLARFPGGIAVPPAVWDEVVGKGGERSGAREVGSKDWIRVEHPSNRALVQTLRSWLDSGESEAIALAYEKQTSVLLDEREGRRRAQWLGLKVLGTVGLLVWAKQTGRIGSLREQLDVLQSEGGFRMSRSLYEYALRTVDELPAGFE